MCKTPVIKPEIKPHIRASIVPSTGEMLLVKAKAITAPPSAKLPSTDKSGKSKIL